MLEIGTAYLRSTAKSSCWIYRTSTKVFYKKKVCMKIEAQAVLFYQLSVHLSFSAPLLMILCQLRGTWKAQCPLAPLQPLLDRIMQDILYFFPAVVATSIHKSVFHLCQN